MKALPSGQMRYSEWPVRQQKILVVDEERASCTVLASALSEAGHYVDTATAGQQAILKLENQSFDLIIADLTMPDVDGVSVLKKAKEADPLCEAIVITGYASTDSSREVQRLGAYDYITKPFNLERVSFLADRALEKRGLLRAAAERDSFERLSRLDAMTGAYNRRHFEELLSAEISRCHRFERPLSLLMIDVDRLKEINDSLGHQAGDALLRGVVSTLKESVRDCDVVARYGGDEFALVLVETSRADAITTARRLTDRLARPSYPTTAVDVSRRHATTISIGVSTYPVDAGDVDELIRQADEGLYAAKARGGNCVEAASFAERGVPGLPCTPGIRPVPRLASAPLVNTTNLQAAGSAIVGQRRDRQLAT